MQCTGRTQHHSERMFNRCIDLLLCSWLLMCGGALKDAIITQWDFKRSNWRTVSGRPITFHSNCVVVIICSKASHANLKAAYFPVEKMDNPSDHIPWKSPLWICNRVVLNTLFSPEHCSSVRDMTPNWLKPHSQGEPLLHLWQAETLHPLQLHLDEIKAL